jgi:hypothetical protein
MCCFPTKRDKSKTKYSKKNSRKFSNPEKVLYYTYEPTGISDRKKDLLNSLKISFAPGNGNISSYQPTGNELPKPS